jgi:hypothetical protein
MRTWKVLKWTNRPKRPAEWIPLDCPCGYEALCPTSVKAPIISVLGMKLVFDSSLYRPPENFLPDKIKCRKCGRIFQ